MWILINMVNIITMQSHISSSFACFERLDSAARVFFRDQRECVLSSLTFTPALQALLKVSHLLLYRVVSSDSCSAWLIPSHQWLLWFPWGLERTSLCFYVWCSDEEQMNKAGIWEQFKRNYEPLLPDKPFYLCHPSGGHVITLSQGVY